MDRLRTNDSSHAFLADQHLLSNQVTSIDAANSLKAIETFAILGNDHEADLIHMRIEHDPGPLPILSTSEPGRQDIAQRIHLEFICMRLHLLEDDPADFALIP